MIINLFPDVLFYFVVMTTCCLAAHLRRSRQTETDDKIYFEDDLQDYKNRIKTNNNNIQLQTNSGTSFGLPQKVLFVPAKSRGKRQFNFGPGGFNDIGPFPRPNGDDDDLPVWGVSGPDTNRRGSKPNLRPQRPFPGPQNPSVKPQNMFPRPQRPTQRPSAVTSAAAPFPSTTELPGPPTWATSPPSCIRNCQITPEYNPVCGTDEVTYTNPGRLRCAQRCGKSKFPFQIKHFRKIPYQIYR